MPCVLREAKPSCRGKESFQEFCHPTGGHPANLYPGLRCMSHLFLFFNWMLCCSLQTPFAPQPSTHWKVVGKVLLSSKGPQKENWSKFYLETSIFLLTFCIKYVQILRKHKPTLSWNPISYYRNCLKLNKNNLKFVQIQECVLRYEHRRGWFIYIQSKSETQTRSNVDNQNENSLLVTT